jgi:glutamate-1-semialdehyde 2,1-aminomutase
MKIDQAAGRVEVARERFKKALPRSVQHYEEARRLIPRGTARSRFWWPLPTYIARAEGPYLFDVDNNRYIDCTLGFGPLILGHSDPNVVAAIEHQLHRGFLLGAPSQEEFDLARLIVGNVVNSDWVIFLNSGTEATLGALRVAHAANGREKIAKFEGGWHGWHDWSMQSFARVGGEPTAPETLPDSMGIPKSVTDQVVVLPFNDLSAVDIIRRESNELSCVIMEGVQGGAGALPAEREFARAIRSVCDETGVVLIYDEVITGFRLGPGGAAAILGIEPDLTTLGKIIGGGLAIGAICGSAKIRDAVEHGTIMAGTFSANPLSMAAGTATLGVLLKDDQAYTRLAALGDRMRSGLVSALEEVGVEGSITGMTSMWGLHFAGTAPRSRREERLDNADVAKVMPSYLLREGILMPAPMHLGFVSTAHSESDVDEVVEAHTRALTAMKADGFFQ